MEETEEERRRRLQREATEQASQGILSWLNPFNWGFSGILLLGLIGGAIYFFTGTARGGDMWNQFTSWLVRTFPSAARWLGGEEAQRAMDHPQFSQAEQVLQRHHIPLTGAKAGLISNPDALFDMLTEAGPFVRDNITGDSANGLNAEQRTQLMTTLRTILNNPQQRNTLLGPQHRATILSIVERLSPIRFPEGRLTRYIEQTGFDSNQPKPEFLAFLQGVLNPDETQRNRAISSFMERDLAALRTLTDGMPLENFPEGTIRNGIVQLRAATADEASTRRNQAMVNDVHSLTGMNLDQLKQRLQDPQQMVEALMDRNIRGALFNHHEAIGDYYARKLREEGDRASVMTRFLATRGNYNNQRNQYANVRAMLECFQFLDQNNQFNQQNVERTRNVMNGLVRTLTGDADALKDVPARHIAEFFANDRNAEIVRWTLNQMNTSNLTPAQQGLGRVLARLWITEDGHGLRQVLDDVPSVERIQRSLGGEGAPIYVDRTIAEIGAWFGIGGLTPDMRHNSNLIGALQRAMDAVEQESAPQRPHTPPQPPAIQRGRDY